MVPSIRLVIDTANSLYLVFIEIFMCYCGCRKTISLLFTLIHLFIYFLILAVLNSCVLDYSIHSKISPLRCVVSFKHGFVRNLYIFKSIRTDLLDKTYFVFMYKKSIRSNEQNQTSIMVRANEKKTVAEAATFFHQFYNKTFKIQ